MASLPSYIVNLDEFNEIFSSALTTDGGPSKKEYFFLHQMGKIDCLQETFSERMIFILPEGSLIYGMKFIESSFLYGNEIQIGKIKYRQNEEIGRTFIYDGYEGIAFNPPILIEKDEKIYFDYINHNCSKKTLHVILKYLVKRGSE